MKVLITNTLKTIGIVAVCCLIAAANAFSQTNTSNKPTIAVTAFDVSGANLNRDVGRQLSDLLVNALVENGRFRVIERSNLSPLQQEQFLALNGSVDPATGAEIGKLIGAQYLVLGSVREFKEKELGLGGFKIKIPGAGKVSSYQAVVKFNLRVVNSTTGEILFSKPMEREIKDVGISDGGFLGGNYKSRAMENAVGQAMQNTIAAINERVSSEPVQQTTAAAEAASSANADCSRFIGAKAPRVMVVIPEVHITQKIPDPAGETEIIKKLVARGFKVVDQKQVAAIRDREKVLTAIKNPQAAAALGVEFGADIIIIGEAFSELAGRNGNMVSTRARVEARAIQTDNARILAADGKFGSGLDIAEFVSAKVALRNAGSQWADYFVAQLCQSPDKTIVSSSEIEIMISNISFNQLKRFAEKLATVPGVGSVERKLTENMGRVIVQFNGNAEKLADAIAETSFGTLRVNIVGLSGSKIEIDIGK